MSERDVKIGMHMQEIASVIDHLIEGLIGERAPFSLLIWPESKMDRFQYVANCPREDVLRVMKDAVARWEAGAADVPAHKIQ